jgi:hypothetical protein
MCDSNNSQPKFADFKLDKVSDTEWLATVDEYTFKVRTLPVEDDSKSGTIRVRFFEVNDQIEGLGTTAYRNLLVEEFTPEWIEKFIVKTLAKHTNFFKENS